MKIFSKYFTILLILFAFSTIAVANGPDETDKISSYRKMMYDEIRSKVQYPLFARELKIEGFVLISFSYNINGGIKVIASNSNNTQLHEYVVTQLESLELCSHAQKPDIVYNMRFDFQLL